MKIGSLSWTRASSTGREEYYAWSDQMCVGVAMVRADGQVWFDATYAVHQQGLAGTVAASGIVASVEDGKAAVEHAWKTWLQVAGLLG